EETRARGSRKPGQTGAGGGGPFDPKVVTAHHELQRDVAGVVAFAVEFQLMTLEPRRQSLGLRVLGGVLAVFVAVAAVSIYAFYRVDRVSESVSLGNQFYVPVLKHLNVVSGKWAAYQRTFESTVSFRKWGGVP